MFEGNFKNNKFHGKGRSQMNLAKMCRRTFNGERRILQRGVYVWRLSWQRQGLFSKMKEALGYLKYSNNKFYKGEFAGGLKEGYGILHQFKISKYFEKGESTNATYDSVAGTYRGN